MSVQDKSFQYSAQVKISGYGLETKKLSDLGYIVSEYSGKYQ